ncbi:ClpXP protease specificity-enhancing factor [Celerinatantimonas sp. MCCC 1A17872]|uniref:ClpXP protease specificity-enhancing factor n=1 Tax=Celerinatantimonas sp. MCCC 1A17872 TaxID=3177514 RepID=UPI0038C40CDF
MNDMTPNRPYLLRAFFDWLLDNQLTPHLVVDATYFGVEVPQQFVQNGQIVLNISPNAVGQFNMGMADVSFSARFGGVPFQVYIPMGAILAIYARENGAGTMFEPDPYYDQHSADEEPKTHEPALRSVDETAAESDDKDNDEPPTPPKGKGRPSLRVIK